MDSRLSNSDKVPDRRTRILATAILCFYLLFYLLPIGVRPVSIPDESRYGEIPREMLSTGDWVVPHYDGLRYFEKPPLGYWLNALSIAAFDNDAFAIRLPSALEAGLTALLVFLLARATLGGRRIALFAALIQMSFLEVYGIGTFSILDSVLTLTLTAGIMCFYLASQARETRHALLLWLASGISLGLAFLSKGFLALAIPVIVLVPWMLWQGRWRQLLSYGWLVAAIAILVALPWSLMIHVREPDFWRYFFWEEHIRRFTAENAQHKEPFYFFINIFPVLAFPWLTLAPAALSGLKQDSVPASETALLRFLWLWFVLPFVFFSISSGKLETYILPCFPPLALLLATGLQRYLQREHTRLFNAGVVLNLAVIGIVLITLVINQSRHTTSVIYAEHESMAYFTVAMSFLVTIAIGLAGLKSKVSDIRLGSVALCILPLLFIVHLVAPENALKTKSPEVLVRQHVGQIPADAIVIADSYTIGAIALVLKRDDIYITSEGELRYGLNYPEAKHRLLTAGSLHKLIEQNRASRTIAMLCSDNCDAQFLPVLPSDAIRYSYGIFDLWLIPRLDSSNKANS